MQSAEVHRLVARSLRKMACENVSLQAWNFAGRSRLSLPAAENIVEWLALYAWPSVLPFSRAAIVDAPS
jgi:hypothetical protein